MTIGRVGVHRKVCLLREREKSTLPWVRQVQGASQGEVGAVDGVIGWEKPGSSVSEEEWQSKRHVYVI